MYVSSDRRAASTCLLLYNNHACTSVQPCMHFWTTTMHALMYNNHACMHFCTTTMHALLYNHACTSGQQPCMHLCTTTMHALLLEGKYQRDYSLSTILKIIQLFSSNMNPSTQKRYIKFKSLESFSCFCFVVVVFCFCGVVCLFVCACVCACVCVFKLFINLAHNYSYVDTVTDNFNIITN